MPHGNAGALLAEFGIRAVISLTHRNPMETGSLPPDMHHLHLPVADMTAPSHEVVGIAMAYIDENLRAGRPVRCACGLERDADAEAGAGAAEGGRG